jgi:hypothetical protein
MAAVAILDLVKILIPVVRVIFSNFRTKFYENRSSGSKVIAELRNSRWRPQDGGGRHLGFGSNVISSDTDKFQQFPFQI